METKETKAAFIYLKSELMDGFSPEDCSFFKSLGVTEEQYPLQELKTITTSAVKKLTHSETIIFLLSVSNSLTDFIVYFYFYSLIFGKFEEMMEDDVAGQFKQLLFNILNRTK